MEFTCGVGSIMQMMNAIFVLFKDLVSQRCGHHTRDAFNRVMVWSLMDMFEGEHPSYCPNGHFYDRDTPEGRLAREPLCGRGSEQFRAVLFANCGDLEHHWQGFGLENPGATAAGPCMFCRCNSSTRPYSDYTDTAAWIPTIYTKESWPPRCSGSGIAPGGASVGSASPGSGSA